MTKIPVTGPHWDRNIQQAIALLRNNRGFFFSGYLDGDALGTMLSLALYLRLLDKKVFLMLPHTMGDHYEFVRNIIRHNSIRVVNGAGAIREVSGDVDTVIFCDTANAQLIPHFATLSECFLQKNLPVVEIDHHFGGDSEALSTDGIRLFRRANASTEIAAELLQALHHRHPELPNPFLQRNILLGLLVGMVTDTGGGKVTPLKDDYSYWIETLGDRLKSGTYADPESDCPPEKNFASPEALNNHLHQVTPQQERCIEWLKQDIRQSGGIGYLNLLDSRVPEILELCPGDNPNWFAPIRNLVLEMVPTHTGKAGLLFYQSTDAHGAPCIFVKIRRAPDYETCDLRELIPLFQEYFGGGRYLGGGGHANAVSFRIRPMPEQDFLRILHAFLEAWNARLP